MHQKNKLLYSEAYLSMVFFLFLIWICLLWMLQYYLGTIQIDKIPKQELVKYYRVDKKTIGKWVKYFCGEKIDFISYNRQRKLELHDYLWITTILGDPNEFPIYTKQKIIEECEGTYTSLRNSIDEYAERFGITGTIFRRLNKFPPSISQQIIQQFN